MFIIIIPLNINFKRKHIQQGNRLHIRLTLIQLKFLKDNFIYKQEILYLWIVSKEDRNLHKKYYLRKSLVNITYITNVMIQNSFYIQAHNHNKLDSYCKSMADIMIHKGSYIFRTQQELLDSLYYIILKAHL